MPAAEYGFVSRGGSCSLWLMLARHVLVLNPALLDTSLYCFPTNQTRLLVMQKQVEGLSLWSGGWLVALSEPALTRAGP